MCIFYELSSYQNLILKLNIFSNVTIFNNRFQEKEKERRRRRRQKEGEEMKIISDVAIDLYEE